MIQSFRNSGTEDIFNGRNSKAARDTCPQQLWKIATRKLDQIDSAANLNDLKVPPGNRLEALQGYRSGQYSIRINEKFRICFQWTEQDATDVEIVDYH
jgi:proteic killer suppression protein